MNSGERGLGVATPGTAYVSNETAEEWGEREGGGERERRSGREGERERGREGERERGREGERERERMGRGGGIKQVIPIIHHPHPKLCG